MSRIFSQTRRQAQAAADTAGHDLLVRAGFVRQLGAGIFSYLPLGLRSLRKIEAILRQEMDAIGGQEIEMPVVNPSDIWKESGRFYSVGEEMTRLKDRAGRDMVLAITHEEVVGSLVRDEIRSYRQLPQIVYQIQTKWRDDPRPRAGLIRVREFAMKDSYTLDRDWDGLDAAYDAHFGAYLRIFAGCGLPVLTVKADTGVMGGKEAHEFMYETPIGEDTLIICDACGYTANRQIARFAKPKLVPQSEAPAERVATPNIKTIKELTGFLQIPAERTAKAVFMMGTFPEGDEERQQLIFAVVRGDMDVNDTKLANAAGAKKMRPATDEEIRAVGAVVGYASPVGVEGAVIIVDDAIVETKNLVSGANEEGYHTRNINYGRDYTANLVTDIAVAAEGAGCPECGKPLRATRGVEVGNIFKLGTRYSDSMGLSYLDEDGKSKPVIMGSYGIGVGRLLACLVEHYHDDLGLTLPMSVAPYEVYLVDIARKSAQAASEIYQALTAAGIEVLFDDRDERAGVKFNDADLIGAPIRITAGDRSLAKGELEMRIRATGEDRNVPIDSAVASVQDALADMKRELDRSTEQSGTVA